MIRNLNHVRPWQHVYECLFNYIKHINYIDSKKKSELIVFNFGPKKSHKVRDVLESLIEKWVNDDLTIAKPRFKLIKTKNSIEKNSILLNSNYSNQILKNNKSLNLSEVADLIHEWYSTYIYDKKNIEQISINQIKKILKKIN